MEKINMVDFANELLSGNVKKIDYDLIKSEATAECKRFAKLQESRFNNNVIINFEVITKKEAEEQGEVNGK